MTPGSCSAGSGRSRRGAAPGFALPLVLLVAVVVAVIGAVMLERQAAHHRAGQRQYESYRQQHAARGLREVIAQWISLAGRGRAVSGMLDDAGRAFQLTLGDGAVVLVSMFDAQGSVRQASADLPAEDAARMEAIAQRLGTPAPPGLLRPRGPVRISAASAGAAVLRAAAGSIAGDDIGERFAQEILAARSQAPLSGREIAAAASRAGADATQRAAIDELFTAAPTLWHVLLEVRGTGVGATGTSQRFAALMLILDAEQGSMYASPVRFLEWRELAPDERPAWLSASAGS